MLPLHTRRDFLSIVAAAVAGGSWRRHGRHPTPRPGVDASKVLTAAQLEAHKDAIPAFDRARNIPQTLDGIRCQCGCSDLPGKYSLLSCFEDDGMAAECDVCQGQVRLAHRLHRAGRTLDEIRAAIEEKYG
jgi:hypothetical protein